MCSSNHRVQLKLSSYHRISEPRSEILGGPELFVDNGSTINLTCLVEFAAEIPTAVQWSHENKVSFFNTVNLFRVFCLDASSMLLARRNLNVFPTCLL